METYLVFARAAYADPLSYQGSFEAAADANLNNIALDTYGDQWVELVLIPGVQAYWAIQEAPPPAIEAQP
jgi:hypothetical protein